MYLYLYLRTYIINSGNFNVTMTLILANKQCFL